MKSQKTEDSQQSIASQSKKRLTPDEGDLVRGVIEDLKKQGAFVRGAKTRVKENLKLVLDHLCLFNESFNEAVKAGRFS